MHLPRLRAGIAVCVAALALALSGCQTYTAQSQSRDDALRAGNIASALASADRDVERGAGGKDEVLLRLEQGAILRAAALADVPATPAQIAALRATPSPAQTQTRQALLAADPAHISPRISPFIRSIDAFEAAARRIDEFEAAARVSVGAEAGALFTNQANLPYRGRGYDKVMLHTYQALNYLHLSDPDAARVELNRALQRQRDALQANARRIEEAQRLSAEARSRGVRDEQGRQGSAYDADRARADPRTASAIAAVESRLNAAILPYGDYVNPFTTFLDALVFTHQATDAADLERARLSWQRVVTFAPQNPYARADYIDAEPDLRPATAPVPAQPARLTYVIFETGAAPFRNQIRIDLPLFLFTNSISYVGMALPDLTFMGGHAPSLTAISSDGARHTTALVASMDSVVAQDFKNEWPAILTRAIISTGTKATIDAVLQRQIEDQAGATGALLFRLATAATQAAVNIADTRTWRSLPKEFHYARLETPADLQLTVSAGGLARSITLEPAAVQVVYVKSPSLFSPLFVGHFILKP